MIPTVCKFFSKYFINSQFFSVLKYEEPLTVYTEDDPMEEQVFKNMEFKVVKINHEFKNVVVSHKALIEPRLSK